MRSQNFDSGAFKKISSIVNRCVADIVVSRSARLATPVYLLHGGSGASVTHCEIDRGPGWWRREQPRKSCVTGASGQSARISKAEPVHRAWLIDGEIGPRFTLVDPRNTRVQSRGPDHPARSRESVRGSVASFEAVSLNRIGRRKVNFMGTDLPTRASGKPRSMVSR